MRVEIGCLFCSVLLAVASGCGAADAAADGALADGDGTSAAGNDIAAAPDGQLLSNTGTKYDAKPVPFEQFSDALRTAACQRLLDCKQPEPRYATMTGCKAFLLVQMQNAGFDERTAKLKAAAVAYDDAQAGQCVAAFVAVACPDPRYLHQKDRFGLTDIATPAACASVFVANLALSAACSDDLACKSAHCVKPPGVCDGKCAVGVGTTCVNDFNCVDGNRCVNGACADYVPNAGEPCSFLGGVNCPNGYYCPLTGNGTCQLIKKLGDTCDFSNACPEDSFCQATCMPKVKAGGLCASGPCADGLVCIGAETKKPNPTCGVVQSGDPCPSSLGSEVHAATCGTGWRCVSTGIGKPGCQPASGLGGKCLGPAQCVGDDLLCSGLEQGNGICQVLPGKGDACSPAAYKLGQVYSCLPPYTCVAGTCSDPPGLGETCASLPFADGCAKGLTCDAQTAKCKPDGKSTNPCAMNCETGATACGETLNADGTTKSCDCWQSCSPLGGDAKSTVKYAIVCEKSTCTCSVNGVAQAPVAVPDGCGIAKFANGSEIPNIQTFLQTLCGAP